MPEVAKKEELNFKDKQTGESAILGTLEGPCASFNEPTRNGRLYDEDLWEKVFNDPIVQEMFSVGGIPGELDHPVDREETCSEKIAIMLREIPKKKNGQLWAKFDILNTPNGRIAYTLAKAGFKFGISSRGSGDVYEAYDGEHVDGDTYKFQGFDLVLLPAVKEARLNLITESFDRNKFDYKKALVESMESASAEDKKIMQETLYNLNIDIDEELINYPKKRPFSYRFINEDGTQFTADVLATSVKEANKMAEDMAKEKSADQWELLNYNSIQEEPEMVQLQENNKQLQKDSSSVDIDLIDDNTDDPAASNTMAPDVISQLQETLLENETLQDEVKQLQEKLAACYTRETTLKSKLSQIKGKINDTVASQESISILEEKLQAVIEKYNNVLSDNREKASSIKTLTEQLGKAKSVNKSLNETLDTISEDASTLVESMESKDTTIKKLQKQVNALSEQLKVGNTSTNNKNQQLIESIETLKKDISIKERSYADKLKESKALVEKYKAIAKQAVEKYINTVSSMYGISATDVKKQLNESYSFEDIDSICENMKNAKLSMSRLPFSFDAPISMTADSKVLVESKIPHIAGDEDDISEDLLKLAGLK